MRKFSARYDAQTGNGTTPRLVAASVVSLRRRSDASPSPLRQVYPRGSVRAMGASDQRPPARYGESLRSGRQPAGRPLPRRPDSGGSAPGVCPTPSCGTRSRWRRRASRSAITRPSSRWPRRAPDRVRRSRCSGRTSTWTGDAAHRAVGRSPLRESFAAPARSPRAKTKATRFVPRLGSAAGSPRGRTLASQTLDALPETSHEDEPPVLDTGCACRLPRPTVTNQSSSRIGRSRQSVRIEDRVCAGETAPCRRFRSVRLSRYRARGELPRTLSLPGTRSDIRSRVTATVTVAAGERRRRSRRRRRQVESRRSTRLGSQRRAGLTYTFSIR